MIVTALLVIAIAVIVGFGVALAVRSKNEFREQNQVVPGSDSPAPASWAGAHSREAKLHRRLGAAVRGAHENPRLVELGLAPQMRSIDAQAMAIDERLVAAAALPAAHRDAAIDPLDDHVIALEAVIAEMVTSITVADSKQQLELAVSAADLRLQALAEARAEVEQIDREISDPPTIPEPETISAAEPPAPPTEDPSEPEPGATSGGTAS